MNSVGSPQDSAIAVGTSSPADDDLSDLYDDDNDQDLDDLVSKLNDLDAFFSEDAFSSSVISGTKKHTAIEDEEYADESDDDVPKRPSLDESFLSA
jgi:hypothetical protein